MSREYYAYWYRLDEKDGFLIYISDEKDGFVVDENGFVPSFEDKDDLKITQIKFKSLLILIIRI